MIGVDWIEHRRGGDGERLGWMAPDGDGFVVIDLLGRRRSGALDWVDAEELLDALGIGYLAEPFELDTSRVPLGDGDEWGISADGWMRVRIVEASPTRILVGRDFGGAVGAPQQQVALPFPMPETLRARVSATGQQP